MCFKEEKPMAKNSKLAVAYLRMSTDRQEHSIESQWRLVSQYAERNGFTIVKRYEDAGISAMESKISKRLSFLQMIDDSESSDWGTVLIYDSSRFSRSLKDSIVYKSMLKSNGVQVVSITEPVIDEDTSIIMDALNGAQNELYIRKLSKNVKRGQEQKVLRGEVFTKPPFGYRRPYPGGCFEIIPEEAQIVRYIYEQYTAGRTIYSLATELAQTEIRTRHGNPFDTRQVERILTNPIYKGWMDVHAGGSGNHYLCPADHPAIIPPDQFDQMQIIFSQRQSKRGSRQKPRECHTHWLSGKVRCGQCGASYFRRSNGGGHRPSFICANYAKGKCIKPPMITEPRLEQLVLEAIRELQSGITYRITILPPRNLPTQADFDAQISRITRALKRAKEAYLSEIDTLEEYKASKTRLEAELQKVQEEAKKAQSPTPDISVIRNRADTLYQLLTNPASTLEEKQAAVEETIERVTVYPDRSISITFYSS